MSDVTRGRDSVPPAAKAAHNVAKSLFGDNGARADRLGTVAILLGMLWYFMGEAKEQNKSLQSALRETAAIQQTALREVQSAVMQLRDAVRDMTRATE